jgi:thiol-disulfide isomerase/thioredoxin
MRSLFLCALSVAIAVGGIICIGRLDAAESQIPRDIEPSVLIVWTDVVTPQMERAGYRQRPLVVLVWAEWCPACKVLKNRTMPELLKSGALDGCSYAEVDYDLRRDLAVYHTAGGSLPQLLWYEHPWDGKPRRSRRLVGAHSLAEIEAFLHPSAVVK